MRTSVLMSTRGAVTAVDDDDHWVECLPDKILLGFEEVGDLLSISKRSVYRLADSGHLRTVRVGHRRLVRRDDLIAFVENLAGTA